MTSYFYGKNSIPLSAKFRALALLFAAGSLALGILSGYFIWQDLVPIFGRIYRNAVIVETPYMAFGLLMAPPLSILMTFGSIAAAATGRKFDPPKESPLFKPQSVLLKCSIYILLYVTPTMAIGTTFALKMKDYTPCPKLLISGSAWQLFWVNDEGACFKPDHYINGNWPCKRVEGKEICIQADDRQAWP
jgi:hypothetical protein